MDIFSSENTISDCAEESLAKALQLAQADCVKQQPLHKPHISTPKILFGLLLWLLVILLFVFFCLQIGSFFQLPVYITYIFAIVGSFILIAVKAKSFVQNAVLLYQKHAPETMRRSCLFVPSCSEYMLLAVEKYGVIVGVYKGIGRILRCHHPNGGEDYP